MTILSFYLLVPELKYDACVYSVLCKPWILFKIATSTKHAKQTEKINSHCRFYGTLCLSFIKVKKEGICQVLAHMFLNGF